MSVAAWSDAEWPGVPLVAGVCTLAAALLIAPVVGGVVTGPAPVMAAGVVALLTLTAGQALTPVLRLPATVPRYLVSVGIGYAAISLVHLCATALLNVGAYVALGVDAVAVVLLAVTAARWPAMAPSSPARGSRSWQREVVVLLLCAGLAALWTRETIGAVPTAQASGVFPAWQDYFLHGAEVSYLRDYPTYAGRSQYLTAVPQPLYHRGSFALAAAFSALGQVPSLATATAYWLPTGLLLTISATFAWGTAMAGPAGGVGAVAAVFLVPDASRYGFENHFLSFHWLMQMASGSGYAVALVVLALTVLVTAAPGRTARALATAGVLVVASAAFRVHIALLGSAMLAWFVLLTWRPRVSRAGLLGAVVLVAAMVSLLWWMESVSLAPHFLTGRSHPADFFLSVHTQANDLPSPFRAWRETHSEPASIAYGFGLLLVAGCGASLAVVPVLFGAGTLGRMGWRVACIPLALVLASLTVILVVPTPAHGDITDFGHRPFVLVYLVFAALAGAGLARMLGEWSARRLGAVTAAHAVVGALAVVGLAVPWHEGQRLQQWWVPQYATIPVPLEAFPATAFIRAHSSPGEQILAASEDYYAILVSLSERRAYLSRTDLFRRLGPETATAVDLRARAHAALGPAPTYDQLLAFGRREGVSWYIADLVATHRWPDDVVSRCAYCGDMIRVYDLR